MSSFLMQFYENKSVPKLIIINADIKDKKLIEETLSKKEKQTISIHISKKGNQSKSDCDGRKKCQRIFK